MEQSLFIGLGKGKLKFSGQQHPQKMINKANRPTMRPQWAVWRLVVVTMAPMMVVMLEGRGRGGYGVDGGSSGGNDNRNNGGEVGGGCGGDGGGGDGGCDGGSSDD